MGSPALGVASSLRPCQGVPGRRIQLGGRPQLPPSPLPCPSHRKFLHSPGRGHFSPPLSKTVPRCLKSPAASSTEITLNSPERGKKKKSRERLMDYFFLPFCCISPLRQQLPALMRRESRDLEAGETTERIKPYFKMGCRFAYESTWEEGGEGTERRGLKSLGPDWG